jgi:hypothetical protein
MKLNGIILCFFAACATSGTGPVATFDNCSSAAGQAAATSILGAVTTALATGDYEAQLALLAAKYSAAEVICAVQLAVSELQKKVDAAPSASQVDPLVASELAHGNAYLTAHAAN